MTNAPQKARRPTNRQLTSLHASLTPRRIRIFALVGFISMISLPLQSSAQAVPDSGLESFLGLAAGTLDGMGNGDATDGSAIKQTFEAKAGDTLTIQWNFLTNELLYDSDPNTFNDFAFIVIDGVTEVADTGSSLVASLTPFADETGFGSYSYVIPSAGTYTLGIGVANVGDTIYESALLVDEISLVANGGFETGDFTDWMTTGETAIKTAAYGSGPIAGANQALISTISVPEPAAIALFAIGVVAVLGRVRLRRS